MDIAVSSYTPSLEALLKPRSQAAQAEPTRVAYPKTLVVSQPATPGLSPISNTRNEVAIIKSLIGDSTTILDDADGTVAAVLQGIEAHNWVHLACHGIQRSDDPTQSSFALYDGTLTLEQLIPKCAEKADLQLAVLSACYTAKGDEKLPEEAVHLAAGMLNVGYKSVIGTMWSIYDASAPFVMSRFYEVMMEQVKEGRELQPAYALHKATKALRDEYGVSDFVRWVPFVHFGL